MCFIATYESRMVVINSSEKLNTPLYLVNRILATSLHEIEDLSNFLTFELGMPSCSVNMLEGQLFSLLVVVQSDVRVEIKSHLFGVCSGICFVAKHRAPISS